MKKLQSDLVALVKEFIDWYEWSGHDVFELFDNPDEIIKEFMNWKYFET